MAFRPRGRHGETLGRRNVAVVSANTAAQHGRSKMNEQRHPGEFRQSSPLVKSMTALSERLFAPGPAPPSRYLHVNQRGGEREKQRRRTKF